MNPWAWHGIQFQQETHTGKDTVIWILRGIVLYVVLYWLYVYVQDMYGINV